MDWFRPRLGILPSPQRALWPRLADLPAKYVLYGGTALALRLGHRFSEDFDFFSSESLDSDSVIALIPWLSEAVVMQNQSNTAEFNLEGVKLSFLGGVSFGRVGEPQRAGKQGPFVASLLDLAATKLKVIAQRAQVKDYLDVAAILKAGVSLETGLGAAAAVYGRAFHPLPTIKALGYFEDGDLPSLPARLKRKLSDAAARVGPIETVRRMSRRLHATRRSRE